MGGPPLKAEHPGRTLQNHVLGAEVAAEKMLRK